jgi:hypothetical protein
MFNNNKLNSVLRYDIAQNIGLHNSTQSGLAFVRTKSQIPYHSSIPSKKIIQVQLESMSMIFHYTKHDCLSATFHELSP